MEVSSEFGGLVRQRREELRVESPQFSVRKVAGRIGIEPAYLSKIERAEMPPPSEETIRKIAVDLKLDADVLLAMAGKVSADLRGIIVRRPKLFAELIRSLKDSPDHAILRVVREVRDGDW
jgi:transcriptional regulator with XRE-family HTH domain